MKVLLTGATGCIGRAVARGLVDRGAELRCLVRPGSDRAVLSEIDCELVEGDLAQPDSLKPAAEGCSTVLHLGAENRPVAVERLHAVNVVGSGELARHAKAAGVERFVYPSTLNCARQGVALPRGWARATRSKLAGESAVRKHLPAVILRAAPCFGPNDHLACPIMARLRRPWPLTWFVGQGTFQTQPIWVEDLADCLVLAALEGKTQSDPREVAGPEVISVLEFWDALAAALGVFRVRVHLPETYLRVMGFPLARATGRLELLRLAETLIAHTAAERNFAPALLGRPMVGVEEGIRKMLGLAPKEKAPAKAEA
jgi:nucleoside-diphosphate-sugar epimerase